MSSYSWAMSENDSNNVADNPMSLPYGSNVGAPAITIPDNAGFRSRHNTANHHLNQRLEEIKREYDELLELAKDTQLCYTARYNFVPIVGKTYHLYWTGHDYMLSIMSPDDWDFGEFVGSFTYETNDIWKRQE